MRLLVTVRFHDGRYHGAGDWPPSPARLFQALMAGVGLGGPLKEGDKDAFGWLERLGAPVIAAPISLEGQRVRFYVPSNDLDAVGGDSGRIAEVRTLKIVQPRLFDAAVPFIYGWSFENQENHERLAVAVCRLADHLYQLGQGFDMAWAQAELVETPEFDRRLAAYPGQVYRPTGGQGGAGLPCPSGGSLTSLEARHNAGAHRFSGKRGSTILMQAPNPRFVRVVYNGPPSRRLFELRGANGGRFIAWPLVESAQLVLRLREAAADKLRNAYPNRREAIERTLLGQSPTSEQPDTGRVGIIPLASIGHRYADRRIRRVLVEVPPASPLPTEDVFWAFPGLELLGESVILTPAQDEDQMLSHYGIDDGKGHRAWRTVTPAALPEEARRRRIDPARTREEAKSGSERAAEEMRAAAAVLRELRTIHFSPRLDSIHVQREPFEATGARAEAFAPGTGFPKDRLWHVEVTFMAPVSGPIVIGDGRSFGLGVMAPLKGAHEPNPSPAPSSSAQK